MHRQGMRELNDFAELKPQPKQDLRALFTGAPASGIDLLQKLLLFNPLKRITALEALKHPYFHTSPLPTHPAKLPKPSAELVPRALPPSEGNGAATVSNKKRKTEADDQDLANGKGAVKIARKLTYD